MTRRKWPWLRSWRWSVSTWRRVACPSTVLSSTTRSGRGSIGFVRKSNAPSLTASTAVSTAVRRRDQDDRQVVEARLEGAQDGHAVAFRHDKISQHDVRFACRHGRQRLVAVDDPGRVESPGRDELDEAAPRRRIALGHEHAGFRASADGDSRGVRARCRHVISTRWRRQACQGSGKGDATVGRRLQTFGV